MDWSNELIIEFLDLFHNEPIIWNPAHKKHKDRNDVNDAWDRIKDRLSADVTIEELKKKKDSLMATYRKLSSKVTKSNIRASKGFGDVLKPEWFAFDKMQSFLHQIYSPRITILSQVEEETEIRKRAENWTRAEKKYLMEICNEKIKVIEDKSLWLCTNKMKNLAWEQIYQNFSSKFGNKRTEKYMKQKWRRIKVGAKKRVNNIQQNDSVLKTEDTTSNDIDGSSPNLPQASSEEPSTSSTKKRKLHHKTSEIEKPPAQDYLRDLQIAQEHDECSLYVALLGKKLRSLDDHNREIAMFQINNIMYHLKQQQIFNNRWCIGGVNQYSSEFSSRPLPFPASSMGILSQPTQSQPSRSLPLSQLSSQLSPGPGVPSSTQIYSSSSSSASP